MLLIGPKTRPFLFAPPAGYQVVALRLKLEWAEPLMGLWPAEHLDSQSDLAAVIAGFTASVLPRLAETDAPKQASPCESTRLSGAASRWSRSRTRSPWRTCVSAFGRMTPNRTRGVADHRAGAGRARVAGGPRPGVE